MSKNLTNRAGRSIDRGGTTASTQGGQWVSVGVAGILLAASAAGPAFVLIGIAEALMRDGFDLTRHSWRLLANGEWGWVYQLMMIATGLATAAGGWALWDRIAPRSVPWLIAGYGIFLASADTFKADPMDGFPVATPGDWLRSWSGCSTSLRSPAQHRGRQHGDHSCLRRCGVVGVDLADRRLLDNTNPAAGRDGLRCATRRTGRAECHAENLATTMPRPTSRSTGPGRLPNDT